VITKKKPGTSPGFFLPVHKPRPGNGFPGFPVERHSRLSSERRCFGDEFTIKTTDGSISKIDYLPKAQARKLYSFAQEQEEKQREYRR
jgi:hypothetical protein